MFRYDDFYFLTEPSQLIYSHCPLQPQWQLLEPAVSQLHYDQLPLVKSCFFAEGMQFVGSDHGDQGILCTRRGVASVQLGFTRPIGFTSRLAYGETALNRVQASTRLQRAVIDHSLLRSRRFYDLLNQLPPAILITGDFNSHSTLWGCAKLDRPGKLVEEILNKHRKKPILPYSITERRVPELIPVLSSQPAGDVSHKPGGRLPLLSARPAVTIATRERAATSFAAW